MNSAVLDFELGNTINLVRLVRAKFVDYKDNNLLNAQILSGICNLEYLVFRSASKYNLKLVKDTIILPLLANAKHIAHLNNYIESTDFKNNNINSYINELLTRKKKSVSILSRIKILSKFILSDFNKRIAQTEEEGEEDLDEVGDIQEPLPHPPMPVDESEVAAEITDEDLDEVDEDILQTIRTCAESNLIANITYQKTSGPEIGEIKSYKIEPYSLRFKNTTGGVEEFLYAYDINDSRIKSFRVSYILEAEPLAFKFSPRWDIEI